MPLWRRMMLQTPPFWRGQLYAAALSVVAMLVRLSLGPLLHDGFPFLCFIPCTLIAALAGGPLAGLGALVYSAIIVFAVFFGLGHVFDLPSLDWARLAGFAGLGSLFILIASLMRHLVRALLEAEQYALTMAREASHRTRNVLAIVQAIGRQTAQGAENYEAFVAAFEARIVALARAQDLQAEPGGGDLLDLVLRAVEPFDPARFEISGPRIAAPDEHAPILGLLLYELATNAVKYGALSAPAGTVRIAWRASGSDVILAWEEHGGPPVAPPTRRGFGSRLIGSALGREQGRVTVAYEPGGLTCEIMLRSAEPAARRLRRSGGDALGALRRFGSTLRRANAPENAE